ncbi:hypothetical protein GV67_05350 [Pseudorhizobium pelagicum]|uniref:Uncharacterized protein n=1 Tax=Pseudorhizobium pelagicum TaxID=1509405 RepID=A0A922NWN7_9HYPH|nr:hypothetical protein GV68_16340 [Pseudorhizobium pelagicum]KEQ05542.1 hypothetical protein GV67_05350 [Pseudorhizobium pelagicum]
MGAGLREVNLDGGKWLIFGGWGAVFGKTAAAGGAHPEVDGQSPALEGPGFLHLPPSPLEGAALPLQSPGLTRGEG